MLEHRQVALVEVVLVDEDDADSITLWVTPELMLRVPLHLDDERLARLVDALCAC